MNMQMNNFNMFNFTNFQNQNNQNMMFTCPYKPIITNSNSFTNEINDPTFINATLQAFACLKCIHIWIQNLNNNKQNILFNGNMNLTKDLFNVYYYLYCGQISDSSNFIINYINIYKNKYGNNIPKDPYHFLFYLMDIVHSENNYPNNPNYDLSILQTQNLQTKRNKSHMQNIFSQFLNQTQNSIISSNFYSILGNMIKCSNCPEVYYNTFKYIIKFKIDDYKNFRNQFYPNKMNTSLTLEECFDCYTGGYSFQCQDCGNFQAKSFVSFFSTNKILIIALVRANHVFCCDVDFKNKLNINDYFEQGKMIDKNYFLKGCVSLNNQGKYFADVCINNYWYRFYENNFYMLENVNQEIHKFEPQLLFYEMEN